MIAQRPGRGDILHDDFDHLLAVLEERAANAFLIRVLSIGLQNSSYQLRLRKVNSGYSFRLPSHSRGSSARLGHSLPLADAFGTRSKHSPKQARKSAPEYPGRLPAVAPRVVPQLRGHYSNTAE